MNQTFKMFTAAIILTVLATSQSIAQDNDANVEKLAGTWTLDVEKTAAAIEDEAEIEMMRNAMSEMKMAMEFRADGTMDMMRGDEKMPGEPKFTLTANEDSENVFDLEIIMSAGGRPPMLGTVEFMGNDAIKITPDDQPGMVLVRNVEVVTMEDVAEFFAGRWEANGEATQKMIEESDDMEMPEDGEIPEVFIVFADDGTVQLGEGGEEPMSATFELEAGEGDNEFVVIITPEGAPQGMEISATVMGKDQVKLQPETEEMAIILDRTKE